MVERRMAGNLLGQARLLDSSHALAAIPLRASRAANVLVVASSPFIPSSFIRITIFISLFLINAARTQLSSTKRVATYSLLSVQGSTTS